MLLLRGARVCAPEDKGLVDILVGAGKILHIGNIGEVTVPSDLEVVDLRGLTLVPGFVDHHVHITGGGGEGGPQTSTPEILVSDIVRSGVTTVFGCLGTDGITRSLPRLLAKAKALEWEGVSTYIFTGAYQFPLPTFTGQISTDIVYIDKVVGVGEVAISDHRSSHPSVSALAELAGQARVAGMIAGKAGKVVVHLGDARQGLQPLFDVAKNAEVPLSQFVPTHLNRNRALLQQAFVFGKMGGFCDFTAGETACDDEDVVASDAVVAALEAGVPLKNLTISSDAQGSFPIFNKQGELVGMGIGRQNTLLDSLRALVLHKGVSLETALCLMTANVADIHKLDEKGRLKKGADADIVALDADLQVRHVWAKGRWAVRQGDVLLKGMFAERRPGEL